MVIDFHTHVFPDSLAARAKQVLIEKTNSFYEPITDMTVQGLLSYMNEWGIDISVVQPVVTKPSQFKTTNEWAKSICSERLISFGGIHPDTKNYKAEIDEIAALGLKGMKFHAEYQDFYLDEDRMLRIYDYAISKGLILLHHAGIDPGFSGDCHTSPKQFASVMNKLGGGTVIAAHFGGHAQWDDVEEYLAGTDVYLDTSMGFSYNDSEQFFRIIKKHGADKVLFASDSPWGSTKDEISHINELPLTKDEKDMIFYKNAKRILGL